MKILTKDGNMCISIYILNKIWPDKNSDKRWKDVDFWCHTCHTSQTCQTMPDGWTFPDANRLCNQVCVGCIPKPTLKIFG